MGLRRFLWQKGDLLRNGKMVDLEDLGKGWGIREV
jgi:hypothetical protein